MSPASTSATQHHGPPLRRLRWVIFGSALLAAALASYRMATAHRGLPEVPAVRLPTDLGEIPAFEFQDQSAHRFGKDEMLGKVSIANFIFTRCPTVCPVFSMKMQRISEKASPKIQLLSFSVDPKHDTPEVLAAYAADYNADPKRWHFLTGPQDQVRAVVEGALKIPMSDEGVDEMGLPDIVHGTHFVLFDGAGRIRGYYNSDDADRIDELIRDADYLASQPGSSSAETPTTHP